MKRLAADDAEAFVALGVFLTRPPSPQLALEALLKALEERPGLPLPLLALALPGLWSGTPLTFPVHEAPGALGDALRGFEDQVLARLQAELRWPRLVDAAAGLPTPARAAAAGLVCEQLARVLVLPDGVGVSQAAVRRQIARPTSDVLEQGHAALLGNPQLSGLLAGVLEASADRARRAPALVSDGEVFLVEHVQSLHTLAARVALAQLARAAQAVESQLPARLKSQGRDTGEAAAQLDDESAFPVGGFSSVTNQGTPENLVVSELVYMDDAQRPDLFDVRFVEGELLYYARDESVAVRRRRRLVVVIDGQLEDARTEAPEDGTQPAVWLLGAVVALVRKLLAWLEAEAVTLELVRLGDDERLVAEWSALELVLREFRERGQLELRTAATWDERFGTKAPDGRTHVALVSARTLAPVPAPDGELKLEGQTVHGRWAQHGVSAPAMPMAVALAQAVRRVLEGVLGAR